MNDDDNGQWQLVIKIFAKQDIAYLPSSDLF